MMKKPLRVRSLRTYPDPRINRLWSCEYDVRILLKRIIMMPVKWHTEVIRKISKWDSQLLVGKGDPQVSADVFVSGVDP
jgi:hypothetical protein